MQPFLRSSNWDHLIYIFLEMQETYKFKHVDIVVKIYFISAVDARFLFRPFWSFHKEAAFPEGLGPLIIKSIDEVVRSRVYTVEACSLRKLKNWWRSLHHLIPYTPGSEPAVECLDEYSVLTTSMLKRLRFPGMGLWSKVAAVSSFWGSCLWKCQLASRLS